MVYDNIFKKNSFEYFIIYSLLSIKLFNNANSLELTTLQVQTYFSEITFQHKLLESKAFDHSTPRHSIHAGKPVELHMGLLSKELMLPFFVVVFFCFLFLHLAIKLSFCLQITTNWGQARIHVEKQSTWHHVNMYKQHSGDRPHISG